MCLNLTEAQQGHADLLVWSVEQEILLNGI